MKAEKFSSLVGSDFVSHTYPNSWAKQQTTGPQRLIIAPSSNHGDLLKDLLSLLPAPFGVLYVLLVSRCDNELGRYQSALPCGRDELESFLEEFKEYFEGDGRHHIWITSIPAAATVVYDQHNVIYAYGPLEEFERVLLRRGLEEGEVNFPAPHAHNYHPEFDVFEQKVLDYWEWRRLPLESDD